MSVNSSNNIICTARDLLMFCYVSQPLSFTIKCSMCYFLQADSRTGN